MTGRETDVTAVLHRVREGDPEAVERLYEATYTELRRIAHRFLRGHARDTLQTTALVHEAYVKLFDRENLEFQDRVHFLAVSARAMRQVLVDHFRARGAQKRGGDAVVLTLEEGRIPDQRRGELILAIDESLERLAEHDRRLAKVVEYKFFGGMTGEEIAAALGLTTRTIGRDWRTARAWLANDLGATGSPP